VYVATPRLLATYGIKASQIAAHTDVLTARPGLAGLAHMEMIWTTHQYPGQSEPGDGGGPSCTPSNDCLARPATQTISNLPSGTSAPNTLITEYAVRTYHLQTHLNGWLIQAPAPLTATQISAVRRVALADKAPLEIASSGPELGAV
jgi:putative ABC transport system permease protein